jgi:hypothetical protein
VSGLELEPGVAVAGFGVCPGSQETGVVSVVGAVAGGVSGVPAPPPPVSAAPVLAAPLVSVAAVDAVVVVAAAAAF